MKKTPTILAIVFVMALLLASFFGYRYYKNNYATNVKQQGFVIIPRKAEFSKIVASIAPYLKDVKSFETVAKNKALDKFFNAGRYEIKVGATNTEIVNMIKLGEQSANSFRIIDFGDVYQMIGRVSKKTELDSLRFVQDLDKIAKEKGLKNVEDLKEYFFVDTYNFFWTVTPNEFFKKFEGEYNDFWNSTRNDKLEKSNLTKAQVYALASIVYKESGGKPDEMKEIAGLYLNRVRKGMKLQSDPTVIYSVNKGNTFSKSIKRVLFKHLRQDSPYNTYLYPGIPPGPICIVDKKALDAVLNPDKNDYIFMVADPNNRGFHKFTASGEEHMKNAKIYQDWLNSRNIKE